MSDFIRQRMSASEFLQLPVTLLPVELLNGEIITMPAPELIHQEVVLNVAVPLSQVGGQVYIAPVDVVFDALNVVQPDVLWIAPDGRCQPDGTKRLAGAPDLIVEVLSPGSIRHDRTIKFLLYERFGVREYWLVDPTRRFLEVWRLEEGMYRLQGSYGAGETFVSPVLDRLPLPANTILPA